jgi:hypothetical protein
MNYDRQKLVGGAYRFSPGELAWAYFKKEKDTKK